MSDFRSILPISSPTMKTVTITEAKKHLGAYLKEAIAGTDTAIICGNRIVALRPVEVAPIDSGEAPDLTSMLTPEQRDNLYARLKKERKEAKRRRRELIGGA